MEKTEKEVKQKIDDLHEILTINETIKEMRQDCSAEFILKYLVEKGEITELYKYNFLDRRALNSISFKNKSYGGK